MDESLFQIVTVALLGVTLLVLLVTLLTLNKLAKRIEEGSPSHADGTFQGDDRVGDPPGHLALPPREDESAAPEPAAQTSTFPAAAAVQESEPAQQEEPEEAAAPAQAEESQPAVATAAPVQEAQPAQASTGFEDAPEEQPFERDGRWWFKRGDELLVYDEQSGQWEPAPANSGAASGSGPSAASPAAGGQADTAQADQDPGSFWKCTSCGAVNGSTATSCRMCFAPKP